MSGNHFSYKTQRNKGDYRQYDGVSESLLTAEPRAQDRSTLRGSIHYRLLNDINKHTMFQACTSRRKPQLRCGSR